MADTTATYPIELDRTLLGLNKEITDQDDRDVDLKCWVSRGDFAGLVIEPIVLLPSGERDDRDWLCLDLLGAIKLRKILDDAIEIMGRWED